MKMKIVKNIHHNEQGNVLIITFAIMVVLSMVIAVYMQRSDRESRQSGRIKQSSEALSYAEAGLNDALWRMNNIAGWDAMADFPKTYINKEGDGIYQVNVTVTSGLYTVTATGGFPVSDTLLDDSRPQRTVRTKVRLANFADYSRFVDGNIGYGSGAVLQGKVHANGDIYCSSSNVTFYSDVSCTGNFTGSTPDWQAGHESGVAPRSLPGSTLNLRALSRGEVSGHGKGLYFNGNRSIDLGNLAALLPDDSTPPNTSMPVNFNGVVYVDNGDAVVKGIPDQGLTLSADGNILIEDQVRYPQDALGNTIPDATIGLVARGQILINDTNDGVRNSEMIIEAALMALDLDASNNPLPGGTNGWQVTSSGNSSYTLTIDGSIITKYGGSAGGYGTRNYNWNSKYSIYTPPYFPAELGGNYEVIFWEEL